MINKEKNKHIDHPDDFSLRIKNKLDDYRMPVDMDIWDNIQSQITPQPKPKRMWIRWVSSAAAIAAMVAFVLFIIPDKTPISNIAENHQELNIPSASANPEALHVEIENTASEDVAEVAPTLNKHTVLAANTSANMSKNTTFMTIAENNTIEETTNGETNHTQYDKTELSDDENNIEEEKSTEKPEPKIKQIQKNKESKPRLYLLPEKKSQNNNWLLAASINSAGGSSNGVNIPTAIKNAEYDPEMLGNADTESMTFKDPGSANTQRLATDDFSNIEHDVPLSFGISVRKDLNDRIGLETGLVYTYLSSTMERTNIPQYRAKQEVHYLGIPVSLVAYLWNDSKWNIYASGGAMIEKGLKQKYTQEMYQSNNLTSSISDDGSVSGVQLSLTASAGVSYAFYQNLSLYVEPRFSYYFDNDQPLSIRTEKQSVFGIGGGIRYKF